MDTPLDRLHFFQTAKGHGFHCTENQIRVVKSTHGPFTAMWLRLFQVTGINAITGEPQTTRVDAARFESFAFLYGYDVLWELPSLTIQSKPSAEAFLLPRAAIHHFQTDMKALLAALDVHIHAGDSPVMAVYYKNWQEAYREFQGLFNRDETGLWLFNVKEALDTLMLEAQWARYENSGAIDGNPRLLPSYKKWQLSMETVCDLMTNPVDKEVDS